MEMINDDGLVDPVLLDQFINYEVVNEVINLEPGKTLKSACRKALKNLRKQGIIFVPRRKQKISLPYLLKVHERLKNNQREMSLPTAFRGRLAPRYGKDLIYAKFWTCVDLFIGSTRKYIGLPANQIHKIASKIEPDPNWLWPHSMTCCETDKETARWMHKAVNTYQKNCVQIIQKDIFEVLRDLKGSGIGAYELFNIFDLDLMCNIKSDDQVREWGRLIGKAAFLPAVIHITTSVGHGITEKQYKNIMPNSLICGLNERSNVSVFNIIEDKYRDRVIPMRSIIVVLTEKEKS